MTATNPSNRSFGILFAAVFGLIGVVAWWHGDVLRLWPFMLSGLTLLMALAKPDVLAPANRAWMRLAGLLRRIAEPIVLGAIFFGILTPVGWGMRLAGRDAMKRRFEPAARTYWIERDPRGPDPAGLPHQF